MNDLTKVLLVGLGGFLGANARFWLSAWIQNRIQGAFPWGTLLINVSGSLVMGLFMGFMLARDWSTNWRLFFAVGILGGYTTFSAFSYESIKLMSDGNFGGAFGYITASVILSVTAAFLGLVVVRVLSGQSA